MPSLSGLHMCCTTSSGHSSRSSSAINSWSGSLFLPKSFSDFKLNFNVFFVIIGGSSFHGKFLFTDLAGQLRQELQQVVHDSHVRYPENGSLGILVDGYDERIALEAGQVLERSADAACHVNL